MFSLLILSPSLIISFKLRETEEKEISGSKICYIINMEAVQLFQNFTVTAVQNQPLERKTKTNVLVACNEGRKIKVDFPLIVDWIRCSYR